MDRAGGAPIPCRQRRGGLARSRPGSLARGGALHPLGRGRRASWPAVTPTPSRATAAAATPRRSRRPRGGGAASTPARGKVAAGPPGFFPDGRRRRCRRRCGSDTVRDADAHGAPRASGGGPSQAEEPRPQARAGNEQEVPQREPVACNRTTATGGAAIIGGNTWRHRHCRQSRHRRRRSQASPSTDRSLLSFPPPTGAAEVGMLFCALPTWKRARLDDGDTTGGRVPDGAVAPTDVPFGGCRRQWWRRRCRGNSHRQTSRGWRAAAPRRAPRRPPSEAAAAGAPAMSRSRSWTSTLVAAGGGAAVTPATSGPSPAPPPSRASAAVSLDDPCWRRFSEKRLFTKIERSGQFFLRFVTSCVCERRIRLF